jgi:tetraacyldisaccharide 4'-kinase
VAVARRAVAEHQAQLILLDDAFQHRRIHRDLDIVLIDALQPFGYRHVLPRGLLREPLAGLRRAQLIALSRADTVDPPRRRQLHDEVRALAPQAGWLEVEHRPRLLVNAAGESRPLEDLRGQRVAAFAGVGNPEGFYRTLQQLDCQLQARLAFPDHCRFDAADLCLLRQWLNELQTVDAVVCTGKDLVKFDVTHLNDRPLWAVQIDVHVAQGCELLESRLREIVQLMRE